MVKTRTSQKQRTSTSRGSNPKISDFEGIQEHNSVNRLLDKNLVGEAILECLSNNDPEGVIEVIEMYLSTFQKV